MKLDTNQPLHISEITQKIADILQLPPKRISYNPITNEIKITLKRNRHVTICTHQIEKIKRTFNCEDIIISSPYRCVLQLKLWYKSKAKHCCCCGECTK